MIRQRSTRIVYQNRWMTVREDEVEFADGSPGIYGVVEKADFSLVIPLDGDHVYLINQFRYPVGSREWEFPQGSYPGDAQLDPAQVAAQELEEETGLRAGCIVPLGFLYEAYGYADQGFHVFLATDLQPGTPSLEPGEVGLEVHRVPLAELERMIRAGELRDAPSVSAYMLYTLRASAQAPRNL